MKCPCKGCTERTVLCHGRCDGYQEWKKYNEEKRAWLDGFRTITSEAGKRKSREKIMARARGWLKK